MYYYNPLDNFCKSRIGAVPVGQEIVFNVKATSTKCSFVWSKDGESYKNHLPMEFNGEYFSVSAKFERGLFWYCFELDDGFLGVGKGLEAVKTDNPSHFQLSVYDADFATPDWLKGGIIYQIFPDRFCSGNANKQIENGKILRSDWGGTPTFLPNENGKVLNNDFFGGDIKGIIDKLDYLKSLSVTAIYLNPIFKAYSNHRYDTGDYMQIDPLLGTEEDFINLVKKADERGIKIILDGVFNHVGDDSIYFNKYGNYDSLGAFQSKESKYYDWFSFEFYPKLYKSWWGILTLPAVNKYNNDYLDYITGEGGVIDKYTKLGIGGWRLDVVDELHSGFVQKIRQAVKKVNPNAVVIGEVWEDASNKIAYNVRREYFLGKELDSVMNYPLKNAILNYVMHKDCAVLSNVVKEQIDHYPSQVLCSLMNILSTHDTFRLLSAVSGESYLGKNKLELSKMSIPQNGFSNAVKRLKIATLLQYTLLGVPSIYYGDEAGMEGYTDPLNRKCFPWGNENLDITAWFKFLGKLRTSYSAFSSYGFKELFAKEGAYVYKRYDKGSEILVAINLSDNLVVLDFEDELFDIVKNQSVSNRVELQSEDFGVFIKKRKNKKK